MRVGLHYQPTHNTMKLKISPKNEHGSHPNYEINKRNKMGINQRDELPGARVRNLNPSISAPTIPLDPKRIPDHLMLERIQFPRNCNNQFPIKRCFRYQIWAKPQVPFKMEPRD